MSIKRGCILLKFYIKPQHTFPLLNSLFSCILLKFYIKPQHSLEVFIADKVVSY